MTNTEQASEHLGDEEELLITDELEDGAEGPNVRLDHLNLSALASPAMLRAIGGIIIAGFILGAPDRSDQLLARLLGLGILLLATTSIWGAIRQRPRQALSLATGLAGIALGLFLLLTPDQPASTLARLMGVALVALAARDLLQAPKRDRKAMVPRLLPQLAVAGLLLAFPTEVFATIVTLGALAWVGLSLTVIYLALHSSAEGAASYAAATGLIADWIDSRPQAADDRQQLYAKILYEGPTTRQRVTRFFALMSLAAIIASMGVITDSTAVVIGAMLIAPLMTPLMGMAISLVMGWPNRLSRSALIAVGGILLAIGIGFLLGWIVPTFIDTASNSQIVARSSPTMLDLIVAVTAGAAGAYGLSRPDVSDSLPGVAIAISLVPPLTVVGISYSQQDWASGTGALLLFLTNAFAILLFGGLTFVLTGVTPLRRVTESQHRVRSWLAALAVGGAIIIGALTLNGTRIATNIIQQSNAERAVQDWLSDHPNHSLQRVEVNGDTVIAVISGPTAGSPKATDMAEVLQDEMGRPMTADLRLVVVERQTATAGG